MLPRFWRWMLAFLLLVGCGDRKEVKLPDTSPVTSHCRPLVITCKASEPGQTVAIGPLKPVKPVSPDATDNEKPAALPEDAGQ